MEDLKLQIAKDGEYIIRTGDAADVKYPKPITISGVIDAPSQFLKGKSVVDQDTHIRIYNQEGKIELYVKDTDNDSMSIITGALKKNADLAEFQINSLTHRYDVSTFLKFIKMKRYFFANKEQHAKLIGNLQAWNAKIETTLAQANDQKGNSNFQIEQKVRAVDGFMDKFELNIPIYQGDVALKFTVEIGIEPKNTAVMLYLFSDELFELEISQRDLLMKTALKEFSESKFSKVVVS